MPCYLQSHYEELLHKFLSSNQLLPTSIRRGPGIPTNASSCHLGSFLTSELLTRVHRPGSQPTPAPVILGQPPSEALPQTDEA
jgi:hypothetical protein